MDEMSTYEVKLKDFCTFKNETGEMHIFVCCVYLALFASIIVLDGKVTRLKCKIIRLS